MYKYWVLLQPFISLVISDLFVEFIQLAKNLEYKNYFE
jgi:hypothetical protein